jgi:hypothetical protein
LPEVNLQLRPKLLALKPGTRIVSHDWDMGEWKPDRTRVVDAPDKQVGLDKKSRVHLWIVPAQLGGTWCARDAELRLEQAFQSLQARFTRNESPQAFAAQIEGAVVHAAQPHGRLRLALHRDKLRVDLAQGPFAPLRGLTFARSRAEACG